MTVTPPDCLDCKHYNKNIASLFSCKAFPDGIPIEIIQSEIKHDKPIEGQKGEYAFKKS